MKAIGSGCAGSASQGEVGWAVKTPLTAFASALLALSCIALLQLPLQQQPPLQPRALLLSNHTSMEGYAALQQRILRETASFRDIRLCYTGYCGPWIEDRFFSHFTEHNLTDATLPYIYLPIEWTLYAVSDGGVRNLSSIETYLQTLPTHVTYFTVVQLAKGLGPAHPHHALRFPPGLRIIGFFSGGASAAVPEVFTRQVALPLLLNELPLERHNASTRDITVSFQGSLTHDVRRSLEELYSANPLFRFVPNGNDWKDVIRRSNFTLCPRGFGETSFRLAEVIQLGSIPIYVWEDSLWLPYQELIDWHSFAIIVHASQIASIEGRVRAVQARYAEYQAALHRVQHMFTYQYSVQYIAQYMERCAGGWPC